jgi:hypothetical protein
MSGIKYFRFVLFWLGVLLWQLISGRALGAWGRPSIIRSDNPATYWFLLAAQGAFFIAFLFTGNSWHLSVVTGKID